MGVAEILLLFVVSVTVVVSLILDSFEKNNKTRHEAEQSSPVLDFESKARIGSFVDKSVNAIDYQDQKQVISDDFKREVFEEIVEEKDGTEYPVREISERSNFCSGVLGISGNMGIIGDDCEREELFDDWEGIERTELEKIFGRAVVFVNNADKFDEDLKLQLYGLQKVALEGPCHESQPMALKVSARSKWNAWEKLGNMSKEMAMEKYIEILSMAVPDWKVNEYSSLKEETLYSWADMDPGSFFVRLGGLWLLTFTVLGVPIAAASFNPSKRWSYVGDRLLSAVIPYEESGWYDGKMWVKPPEILARDRLLGSYKVKPVIKLLKQTLVGTGALLVGAVSLFIFATPVEDFIQTTFFKNNSNVAESKISTLRKDELLRLPMGVKLDDDLAASAAEAEDGRPFYCRDRYYRALAGGQYCKWEDLIK